MVTATDNRRQRARLNQICYFLMEKDYVNKGLFLGLFCVLLCDNLKASRQRRFGFAVWITRLTVCMNGYGSSTEHSQKFNLQLRFTTAVDQLESRMQSHI